MAKRICKGSRGHAAEFKGKAVESLGISVGRADLGALLEGAPAEFDEDGEPQSSRIAYRELFQAMTLEGLNVEAMFILRQAQARMAISHLVGSASSCLTPRLRSLRFLALDREVGGPP